MKTVTDAVRELGGVWPFCVGGYYLIYKHGLGYVDFACPSVTCDCQNVCTRTEFDAEVERLRNKPEWHLASPGYTWRWQNADGRWMFGKGDEPRIYEDCFVTGRHKPAMFNGEVLGDWRDTLEHRPVEISKEGVERIMKAINGMDWYERGELPPVGTVCEYLDRDGVWREVEVLARTKKGAVVEWDDCEFLVKVTPSGFRPLRSDRERWVETALKVADKDEYETAEQYTQALYDAMINGTLPTPRGNQ